MAYKYIKDSQPSLEPKKSKVKTKGCNHTPSGIAKIKNMDKYLQGFEQVELSSIADRNMKYCKYFRNQFGSFLQLSIHLL